VGDLDGDGRHEIVLKWYASIAKDNAFGGYSGETLLDAYTLDRRRLWRIVLGRNIRSGAHYTQFFRLRWRRPGGGDGQDRRRYG
jgi:rhamnogalacturonan endolyase